MLWMREEEQLAHDVYVVLGDLWGLRIFENIAASETTHIDLVSGLLDRHGIDDPTAGNDLGTFTDPTLQGLYDQLIADGSESLEAALGVGALIEELDISDLQARSAATEISRDHRGLCESRTRLAQPPSRLHLATRDARGDVRADAARHGHVRRNRVVRDRAGP